MADWIIRNARVMDANQDKIADVALREGKIERVATQIDANARQEIDAAGKVLFAGGIDAHVHFNEPGRRAWEGIETGSAALAKGGMTSYFDMPLNSTPPVTTVDAYHVKRDLMDKKSLVNGYIWAGLTPDSIGNIAALAEEDIVGFKAFMSNSGISDFAAVDDGTLYEGMQRIAETGKILAVHAENDGLTAYLSAQIQATGRTSALDYLHSRPAVAEHDAIQRALLFAEATGCALHIVHVSTAKGVALVNEARERGVNVSCETCPHYLVLCEADVERIGAAAKCAPPIRSETECEALWHAVLEGQVDFIASDHSPAPLDMKQDDDFFAIWGGIAGCQSTLSLLLTEGYHARGLSLSRVSALLSGNVAARFGLTNKGTLAAGFDADLTLVDVEASYTLQADDLAYRHSFSPYIGMPLRGIVQKTWVKGELVYG